MLFPLIRPFFPLDVFAPEQTLAAASPAFASLAWVVSHFLAMLGFLLLQGQGPMTIVLILGLLFLAVGAFNVAVAIRRSGKLPVWAGFVFAIGLALWLPLLPKPVRILDGLLIGIGGIPLAWSMWRKA